MELFQPIANEQRPFEVIRYELSSIHSQPSRLGWVAEKILDRRCKSDGVLLWNNDTSICRCEQVGRFAVCGEDDRLPAAIITNILAGRAPSVILALRRVTTAKSQIERSAGNRFKGTESVNDTFGRSRSTAICNRCDFSGPSPTSRK